MSANSDRMRELAELSLAARRAKAAARARLRAGELTAELLADPSLAKTHLVVVLEMLPGRDRRRRGAAVWRLAAAGLTSPWVTCGQLTDRQRQAIAGAWNARRVA